MADQPADQVSQWLLTPLQPKEARIFVAVSDDAELTPALRSALEQLAAAMQSDEPDVQGYDCSGQFSSCSQYNCDSFACSAHHCGQFGNFAPTLGFPQLSFGLFRT
jgi:uncharacterized protein with von Willebrand factor type A (vWA) domain